MRKNPIFNKISGVCALLAFLGQIICPVPFAMAQGISAPATVLLSLPEPGAMVPMSASFIPPILKGISLHPENPLLFDFIIDTGEGPLMNENLRAESTKLIKYFMAALTVPEEDLWVNLSPNEDDRIIPEGFGLTEMGRDLLAQDYLLKQITSSLMYPEKELGKKFWDRVYTRANELYGTTEIPLNTFNKVWIVPESARIFRKDHQVFVVDSHLKVMLEEDYIARRHNPLREGLMGETDEKQKDTLPVMTDVVREVLVPELEREVNEGKNFALLRQVYNSLILAVWYKRNLKDGLLSQVYVDQNKVLGIDLKDASAKQQIYDQYLQAFKKGVFDYIKEDYDQFSRQLIPRKYFSGGFASVKNLQIEDVSEDSAMLTDSVNGGLMQVRGGMRAAETQADVPGDAAMLGGRDIPKEELKPLDTDFYHEGQRFLVKKVDIGSELGMLNRWFKKDVSRYFPRYKWVDDMNERENIVMITLTTVQGDLVGLRLTHEAAAMDGQRVFYSDRVEIDEKYQDEGINRKFLARTLKWVGEHLPLKFDHQPVLYSHPIEDGEGAPEGLRAEEGRQIKKLLEHMGFSQVRDEVLEATGDEEAIAKLSYWELREDVSERLIERVNRESEEEKQRIIKEELFMVYKDHYFHDLNNFFQGLQGGVANLSQTERLKQDGALHRVQKEMGLLFLDYKKLRDIFYKEQTVPILAKREALERFREAERPTVRDLQRMVSGIRELGQEDVGKIKKSLLNSLGQIEEHLVQGIVAEPKLQRFALNDFIAKNLAESHYPYLGQIEVWQSMDTRITDVMLDRHKINRVLDNLMKNAYEAMDGKGEVRVMTKLGMTRREVEIKFSDTGKGIAPDKIDQVFEPHVSSKGSGRGFGLTIIKRMVEEHGGSVRLDSQLGKGTTFTITLPVNTPVTETEVPKFEQQKLFEEAGDQAMLTDVKDIQDVSYETLKKLGLQSPFTGIEQWFADLHPSSLFHNLLHSQNAAGLAYVFAKARGLTEQQATFLFQVGLLHDLDPHRNDNTPASVLRTLKLLQDDFNGKVSIRGEEGHSFLKETLHWGLGMFLAAKEIIQRTEYPFEVRHPDPDYGESSPVQEYFGMLETLKGSSPMVARFVAREAPIFTEYADRASGFLVYDFKKMITTVLALAREFNIREPDSVNEKDFVGNNFNDFIVHLGSQGSFAHDREALKDLGRKDAWIPLMTEMLSLFPKKFYQNLTANFEASLVVLDRHKQEQPFYKAIQAGQESFAQAMEEFAVQETIDQEMKKSADSTDNAMLSSIPLVAQFYKVVDRFQRYHHIPFDRFSLTRSNIASEVYVLGRLKGIQDKIDYLLANAVDRSGGEKVEVEILLNESGGVEFIVTNWSGILWKDLADRARTIAEEGRLRQRPDKLLWVAAHKDEGKEEAVDLEALEKMGLPEGATEEDWEFLLWARGISTEKYVLINGMGNALNAVKRDAAREGYDVQVISEPDKTTFKLIYEEAPAQEPDDYSAMLMNAQEEQPVFFDEFGNPVGGIDLNPAGLDLQVDGEGIDISADFDPARLQTMQVNGFVPVIFSITPIPSLPLLLGEAETPETTKSLPDSARYDLDPAFKPELLALLD